MSRAVRSALVVLLSVVLSFAAAQAHAVRVPRQVEVQHSEPTAATPLRHIVVMSQQGHSFDNYFSHRTGVDGLPASTCLPAARGTSQPCVRPSALAGSPHAKLLGTAASEAAAVNAGRMDGFVRAQAVHGSNGRIAMGYYPTRQLPMLNGIADRGVVFDRWFAAVPGPSVPNDLFSVAATSPAKVDQVPTGGWGNTPLIFDRLQRSGVSWRIYVEDYKPTQTINTAQSTQQRTVGQVARVPVLASPRFVVDPALRDHVVDIRRYYDDLAQGHLPAVSFVVTTQSTELAPRNPSIDGRLVRNVVNGLLGSSAWQQSAFFLTYATSGGWYDHVLPPMIGGTRAGIRVPTVLVSPYASAGTVNSTTYDSAAILKLIEQNWSLSPLTTRDRAAASLLPLFHFRTEPAKPALVGVAPSRPAVQQPSRTALYVGYLLALAAALACLAFVFQRRWPLRLRQGTSEEHPKHAA